MEKLPSSILHKKVSHRHILEQDTCALSQNCIAHISNVRMDASALLQKQGWLGAGHALDRAGRGVKKPLLVSKRHENLGVGKKKVDVHADQWWARAFDEGLKGINPGDTPEATTTNTTGTSTPTGGAEGEEKTKTTKVSELSLLANGGRKWLGLYDGFVKGKGLEGTISSNGVASSQVVKGDTKVKENRKKDRKRKRVQEITVEELDPKEAVVSNEGSFERRKKKKKERTSYAATDSEVLKTEAMVDELPSERQKTKNKKKKKETEKKKKRKHAEDQLSAG